MKDLLRVADLSAGDLSLLLKLAAGFQDEPTAESGLLAGRIVPMYFAKPSTRTRLSTAAAVTRLGGAPVPVGPDELQLRRGETIGDTARVMGSYAAAVVIRTFADADVAELAAAAPIPVINALTDGHHPLQAVADLLTVKEHFGDLRGHRIAYVGDGANNVARSLTEAAALAGMDIAIAAPDGYLPGEDAVASARAQAERHGGSVTVTQDPAAAVNGANVVYTDVWLSMGDSEDERAHRKDVFAPYQVNQDLMDRAGRDAVFMHCLPAHRGEEVTAAVIDGGRSLAFRQAANRLPAAQAVLYALLTDRLEGHR
ncbi:MAG TPA: ornithine carbamoyltransferase [Spirillospora sp.]|nr:ornithine carbamoyltransferase [Spirillospora sp.]